jgi:YidC/Oxa1 family membrane protein insertase
MDNFRLILFFSLALVLLLIYQAWMRDYGALPLSPPTEQTATAGPPPTPGTPAQDIPPVAVPDIASTAFAPSAPATDETTGTTPIRVETDLLRLEISPLGGALTNLWLKDYAVSPGAPDSEFQLLKQEPPNMFVVQSGLRGPQSGQLPSDTGAVLFSATQDSYVLGPKQDNLEVELTWGDAPGVQIKKRYRFTRGSYAVDAVQEIVNPTDAPVGARSYTQLERTELHDPTAPRFVYTYTGGVYYSPEDKYKKLPFDKMREEQLRREVTNGWVAMIQHYFMAAWIPPEGSPQTFFTGVRDGSKYLIGTYTPSITVAPGSSHTFEDRLFVGPKLQDTLASVAPGLDLAVDYGWLTILAQPIFWLLEKIHAIVGNWGWAIIILTILIKAAFFKLSETSYKSMANMRRLTPRLQALKDRYGDDKQRLNQAMMEIYKQEKINPLGGCLPIVIQIPVFISLYWVLLESVELRQAPFALWINNLSAPDPYFVLPLIMGVSMYVQQKLNPAPPDPIQAKVMMSLPFVFTVFFAFFPSGLVLYWVVNNLLSISQQWYITRKIEQAAAKH